MPAIAALSLVNQAAATVAFAPINIDSTGLARYSGPGSVMDAQPSLTISLRRPKVGSNVSRAQLKIAVPKMDPVDVTKKVAENYVNIEFVFHKNSSATERLDVNAFAKSLLANALLTTMITNVEGVY